MISAQKYTFTIGASALYQLQVTGAHLRILSASGALDVVTDKVRFENCGTGDGFDKVPFSRIEFKDRTGAANTVTVVVSDAEFLTSPVSQVLVTRGAPAQGGSVTNTQRTVTNASAQLLAANTARSYLLVQNKDTSGTIYLNFGAGAATSGNGLAIGPGGYFEWDFNVPTQAIQAIGDIASNTNILTIEG